MNEFFLILEILNETLNINQHLKVHLLADACEESASCAGASGDFLRLSQGVMGIFYVKREVSWESFINAKAFGEEQREKRHAGLLVPRLTTKIPRGRGRIKQHKSFLA